MATIKEDYVSFEIAKLLKEKGFNEATNRYYNAQYNEIRTVSDTFITYWNNEDHMKGLMMEGAIAIPTPQMAMKWLREVHNLFIEIQCYGCEADEKAHFEYSYVISEYVKFDNKICTTVGLDEKKAKSQFKSYEEACEAAIKYCLENLIK